MEMLPFFLKKVPLAWFDTKKFLNLLKQYFYLAVFNLGYKKQLQVI